MRILFLSRWYPYPPDNGSKIRAFNLIKHLGTRHQVDLISFASGAVSQERITAMERFCGSVDFAPYRPFRPGRLKSFAGFFSRQPRWLVDTFSIHMQRLVDQASHTHRYDAVIAAQIDMAPYAVGLSGMPKILEEIQLIPFFEGFVNQPYLPKRFRRGLMWWKLSRYLADLLPTFEGCTVVSEAERALLLQVSPGVKNVEIVPNGVALEHFTPGFDPPEPDALVYPGALTYDANFDAVDYFLREVFPLIRAERPHVKLYVTGKLDGVPVNRLPTDDNVVFTGYLDDVRPRVAKSWATVVPLRMGGGTRLKILESLALGTPVVATTKGAEGLDLTPGQDLLVADEPAGFAKAILHLLQDVALRERLGHSGRKAVGRYDWQIIGEQFCDFVEGVVAGGQKE